MKKALFILAIVIASAGASFAQSGISIDVINGNRAPNPHEMNMMRMEEAKHPNIARSMHDLENAMRHLQDAPDEFGGHKAEAEIDLKRAWISLRKALYYSLYHGN